MIIEFADKLLKLFIHIKDPVHKVALDLLEGASQMHYFPSVLILSYASQQPPAMSCLMFTHKDSVPIPQLFPGLQKVLGQLM